MDVGAHVKRNGAAAGSALNSRYLPWSLAMQQSLYSPDGFYTLNNPYRHFRTSTQIPSFARAIAELVRHTDSALGTPGTFALVDVGAGSSDLLKRILELEDLDGRLVPTAVELRPEPEGLDDRIAWRSTVPENVVGLLLACEYLDNVPLDIAVIDEHGDARYELVDPATGAVRPGEIVSGRDAEWLRRWWPTDVPGERAEIGRSRDEEYRRLVDHVSRGTIVIIDYGHTIGQRPQLGTITGFLNGHEVEPIPNGSRDITAHVAMDALGPGRLLTQREALWELGISGKRPKLELSRTDPVGYVKALSEASDAAELTDPSGLGGHRWLLHNASALT